MLRKTVAPINFSKLGFRYFRIILESKAFSRKFINELINHPNTGFVFQGSGWSGKKKVLGVGLWATNNAEITDISDHIRSRMVPAYKIVYQSELTRLEFFPQIKDKRQELLLIDELEDKVDLDSKTTEYLKLVSFDGTLSTHAYAGLLDVSDKDVLAMQKRLKHERILYGVLPNEPLPKRYTKYFVDTSSLSYTDISAYYNLLKSDPLCVYIARGNGKYNIEFEYIVKNESTLKNKYGVFVKNSKRVVFTDNLYTNLFPQSKFINASIVQREFLELAAQNKSYYDLRNSKLWYVSHKGAEAYMNVSRHKEYQHLIDSSETELFPRVAYTLRKQSKLFNVIDLGSGDGMKGKKFIDSLGNENVKAYFPIDIQEVELSRAISSHKQASYSVHPTVLGFEKLASRFPINQKPQEVGVFLMLGGTYCNFDSKIVNEYLKPALQRQEDRLIVSSPIRDYTNVKQLLSSYLQPNMEEMSFSVLRQIGFEHEHFRVNPKNRAFIMHLRYEDDCVVTSYILEKEKTIQGVRLPQGTRFDITTSWKPKKVEFLNALDQDFNIDEVVSNRTMCVAICSKK